MYALFKHLCVQEASTIGQNRPRRPDRHLIDITDQFQMDGLKQCTQGTGPGDPKEALKPGIQILL